MTRSRRVAAPTPPPRKSRQPLDEKPRPQSSLKRYERRRRLSLALVALICSACHTTVAPVLPLEASWRGIPERWVSAVSLAFSISSVTAPTFAFRRLESTGTVGVMARSMVGMSLLFLCLGLVFSLLSPRGSAYHGSANHGAASMLLILVVQFFMGGLLSSVSTVYFSLATFFVVEKESALSSIEAAIGVGSILGPIFGSMVYAEMGYRAAYAFVSLVMMVMALISWTIISPYFLDNGHKVSGDCVASSDFEAQNDFVDYKSFENDGLATRTDSSGEKVIDMHAQRKRETQKPTFISLLNHPKILLSAATIMWINVSWTCIEPLLAKRLDDYLLIVSLNNAVYVPAVYLAQYLPRHNVLRHQTISLSTLLTPIAMLFVGYGDFPLIILGVLLLGLLSTPVRTMLLPLMQEESLMMFPEPKLRRCLNDITAAIYNSFMLLGQVIGYAIGAMMRLQGTMQIVTLLIFFHAILFHFVKNGHTLSTKQI